MTHLIRFIFASLLLLSATVYAQEIAICKVERKLDWQSINPEGQKKITYNVELKPYRHSLKGQFEVEDHKGEKIVIEVAKDGHRVISVSTQLEIAGNKLLLANDGVRFAELSFLLNDFYFNAECILN